MEEIVCDISLEVLKGISALFLYWIIIKVQVLKFVIPQVFKKNDIRIFR